MWPLSDRVTFLKVDLYIWQREPHLVEFVQKKETGFRMVTK